MVLLGAVIVVVIEACLSYSHDLWFTGKALKLLPVSFGDMGGLMGVDAQAGKEALVELAQGQAPFAGREVSAYHEDVLHPFGLSPLDDLPEVLFVFWEV